MRKSHYLTKMSGYTWCATRDNAEDRGYSGFVDIALVYFTECLSSLNHRCDCGGIIGNREGAVKACKIQDGSDEI